MRALATLPRPVAATTATTAAASPRAFFSGFRPSVVLPRVPSAKPLRLSERQRAELGRSGAGGRHTRAMASGSAAGSGSAAAAYADEVVAAENAVRLACALCETVQRGLKAEESASKSDESPVTIADYGSQVLVAWALQQHGLPGPFSMVAEEDSSQLTTPGGRSMLQRITALVNATIAASAEWGALGVVLSEGEVVALIDAGAAQGGKSGRHWVLDPIDGTRGFMRGDQYAVALGLLDEGEVVVGVLGCPNLPSASIARGVEAAVATGQPVGCVFSAVRGRGTTVQALDGSVPTQHVHVSTESNPASAIFCESYESRHSKHTLTASIAQALGVVAPPVRIDSQAKYGAMARGDAAIYMRFPLDGYREKIWDHAAGSLVISEAGGKVCDAAGQPLDFSRGRFLDLDTGIIATNATLMPVLLSTVQSALKREAPLQS
ncbi:hypothetical protein CLOM_g17125 [Closterium sp. NIES-68]|nr:hypothetical protein CLOM_g17125 [Closterium sp. NIES-68]GJP76579.1 hypothetical protein CLOP_g7002 [Closterium sp. NIES-67]